jgi:hypothetical protein
MDGRHGPADDLEIVMHNLGDRSQTIGGARSIRNDVVLGRIVNLMVHAEHKRDIFILSGRRNDDLLNGAPDVLAGFFSVGETPRGF